MQFWEIFHEGSVALGGNEDAADKAGSRRLGAPDSSLYQMIQSRADRLFSSPIFG
jgi:hypothetical protein